MRTSLECISAWMVALGNNDVDAANGLLHPDYELIEPQGVPYAGVYRGQEGWWSFWKKFGETWTDIGISDQKVFTNASGGDDCAIMMKLKGRSIKTGRTFETTLMEHWTFKEGRILSMRPHYNDTAYLAAVNGFEGLREAANR